MIPNIVLVILEIYVVVGVLFLIGSLLYFVKGWFKRLYHDLLDWHLPSDEGAICKHCKLEIMQDSQGNWYLTPDAVRRSCCGKCSKTDFDILGIDLSEEALNTERS